MQALFLWSQAATGQPSLRMKSFPRYVTMDTSFSPKTAQRANSSAMTEAIQDLRGDPEVSKVWNEDGL